MIPVKDNPDWSRNGVAIVNTDLEAYQNHMKKKATLESQQNEINTMKTTINNLNGQMASMVDAVNQILTLLKK